MMTPTFANKIAPNFLAKALKKMSFFHPHHILLSAQPNSNKIEKDVFKFNPSSKYEIIKI